MPDIASGDFAEIKDEKGGKYFLAHLGGIYSCTCPEWQKQQLPEVRRTCTHLSQYRGESMEQSRIDGKSVVKKVAHQLTYEPETDDDYAEPPGIDDLASGFENELDLKRVDRFSSNPIIFFRKHPQAYLEVETYQLPADAEPDRPSVMYVRKVTFTQEVENKDLAELVHDVFSAMGWRLHTS